MGSVQSSTFLLQLSSSFWGTENPINWHSSPPNWSHSLFSFIKAFDGFLFVYTHSFAFLVFCFGLVFVFTFSFYWFLLRSTRLALNKGSEKIILKEIFQKKKNIYQSTRFLFGSCCSPHIHPAQTQVRMFFFLLKFFSEPLFNSSLNLNPSSIIVTSNALFYEPNLSLCTMPFSFLFP